MKRSNEKSRMKNWNDFIRRNRMDRDNDFEKIGIIVADNIGSEKFENFREDDQTGETIEWLKKFQQFVRNLNSNSSDGSNTRRI